MSNLQRSMGNTFDVFHLRLRWTEPNYWNDDFDDSARHYLVQCAIQDTNTKEVLCSSMDFELLEICLLLEIPLSHDICLGTRLRL